MRPVFVIYLTAGITLTFALISAVAHAFIVHSIQLDIVAHNSQGEALAMAQELIEKGQGALAVAVALAVTQAIIIFSARRMSKQRQPTQQARCSEPGDDAPVDSRGSVAPGH